jgi:hypothetical protein
MAAAGEQYNNDFLEENVILQQDVETQTQQESKEETFVPITEPMTDCPICLEDFNKKSKIITCTCGYTLHLKCCQDYLLYQSKDPHCMYCKKVWNIDFQYDNLTKSFINGKYKTHRKQLLFEREKAQFPATMNQVIEYKKIHDYEKELEEKKIRLNELKQELYTLEGDIYTRKNRISNMRRGIYAVGNKSQEQEKKVFIKPCPVTDCRGFLSTAYKCGVCATHTCAKCFEVKGKTKEEIDEHVCDENNVKNAEAIKSETKGCPKCGVPIYKISGCDQMWCTNCNIAFSWKTGRVETGRVHNPHYYQWIKTGGEGQVRNPGDVVCGGLPDYYTIYTMLRYTNKSFTCFNNETAQLNQFINILYRRSNEVQQYLIDPLREKLNTATNNTDLRVRYLANEIDETHLKTQITARDKLRQKNQSMLHILELYMITVVEYINTIKQTMDNDRQQKEYDRLHLISVYCNDEFLKIAENYKMKVYCIDVNDITLTYKKLVSDKELRHYIDEYKAL